MALTSSNTTLLLATIILLMLANVESRRITLNSDAKMVMPRVNNHLETNFSFLAGKPKTTTCVHYYSFLPCAYNIPGFIFQIIILEYLLLIGDKVLTKGRQKLFNILGVGIYGATLFRVLAVLPTIVLLLASGLALDKKDAQIRIQNGVGTLAGSTVFYLTLQWGICIVLGRTKRPETSTPCTLSEKCLNVKEKLLTLKEYSVKTDGKTGKTAGIMLLSLIPFVLVELASSFDCRPWGHLLTMLVVCGALMLYFFLQSRYSWLQERSLTYSKDQLLLAGFLDQLQKIGKRRILNDEGKPDESCMSRAFKQMDKNNDNHVSKEELEDFLTPKIKSGDLGIDEQFIKDLIKVFDKDDSGDISMDEFVAGFPRIVSKAKEMVDGSDDSSLRNYLPGIRKIIIPLMERKRKELADAEEKMKQILSNQFFSCLLTNGEPDENKIKSLFNEFDKDKNQKLTENELIEMLKTKLGHENFDCDDLAKKMMKLFDKDEDKELQIEEFSNGMKRRLSGEFESINYCLKKGKENIGKRSKRAVTKAILLVILGVAIVSSLGLPLIYNTQLLSEKLGIPPFFVSFVLLPFAVNFKTAAGKIYPATQKKEDASSIMFSEIYGEVFMNNIMGLLTLLGLIWARGFAWDYSAEVLVIFVVTAIIGLIAYVRNTYPFWICLMAFSFYPLSLVFYYVIRYVVGWK